MNKASRERVVRDAKCNLILDAALKVFADKGFHNARLEDIAEAAGFSKASLYNYYENKEVIFLNLANREYLAMVEAIKQVLDPRLPLEENLRRMLTALFAGIGEHFPVILTISHFQLQTLMQIDQLYKAHKNLVHNFKEKVVHMNEIFVSVLEQARRKKEIKSPLPASVMASYLGALIRETMRQWKMGGRMGDVKPVVDNIVGFMMKGING